MRKQGKKDDIAQMKEDIKFLGSILADLCKAEGARAMGVANESERKRRIRAAIRTRQALSRKR